jgi:hypothetical protein
MTAMLRSLEMTSTPAPPVSLADAKLGCRIDNALMDAHVQDLVDAAIEEALARTGRSFCTTTWLVKIPSPLMQMQDLGRPPLATLPAWPLYIAAWPLAPYFELPRPPLVSVQWVKYYDPNENFITMDPAIYSVDAAPRFGRICLLPNQVWPITDRRWDAMQIAFTAGYGVASSVPAGIRIGIKKLVSYWFYNPDADDVPAPIGRIFDRYASLNMGY